MKIVLDVGSNWETLEDCFDSIKKAELIGADAVKFQCYTNEDLFGIPGELKGGIPERWFGLLRAAADNARIEFMCSVFDANKVLTLDPYVRTHKIASSELRNIDLLRRTGSTGKPVILSCGGASYRSISTALKEIGKDKVTLLYCVVDYPARTHALSIMQDLKKKYHVEVGYSDHSLDIFEAPMSAKRLGASVLEKHFKIRDFQSGDNAHSLNTRQARAMIDYVHSGICAYQEPTQKEYNSNIIRRAVATQLIRVGEILVKDVNYGMYRHEGSLQRAVRDGGTINGMVSKIDVNPGDMIYRYNL